LILQSLAQSAAVSSARPLLATSLVRDAVRPDLSSASALESPRAELLYATSANPTLGAFLVADASAARLGQGIDWLARSRQEAQARDAWLVGRQRAWEVLQWLAPAPMLKSLAPLPAPTTSANRGSS